MGGNAGFKNDIFVTDGTNLYLRHKAFDLDLADATSERHIVPSGGFLDAEPQHRTCWALTSSLGRSSGDILVSDGKEMWSLQIPITGKAMAMAGEVLFVAGEPMKFDDPSYKNCVAAYNGELGGRLLAVSATDGKKLAQYKLNAAPVWDSIAIADGQLYIGLADGTVQCLGQ